MPVKETIEPERDRPPGEIRAAGEAMQHGREGALPRFLLQHSRHVLVRVARMDDERQPGRAGGGDVAAKAFLLGGARAGIVVIVEPGLADGHHLGMAGARDQLVGGDVELLVGMVRMGADRAVDLGKPLGDRRAPRRGA